MRELIIHRFACFADLKVESNKILIHEIVDVSFKTKIIDFNIIWFFFCWSAENKEGILYSAHVFVFNRTNPIIKILKKNLHLARIFLLISISKLTLEEISQELNKKTCNIFFETCMEYVISPLTYFFFKLTIMHSNIFSEESS